MAQRSQQFDSDFLLKHGILMIFIGTAVCALGSLMTRPVREQSGYLISALFIAGYFLVVMLSQGKGERWAQQRSLTAIFAAVGSAMACYMIFFAIQSGAPDILFVGLPSGLLGLYWAWLSVRLASTFQPKSPQAVGLCALAATISSFAIIFGTRTDLSKLSAVSFAGAFVIVLGIQTYLSGVMVHREVMREKAFDRR